MLERCLHLTSHSPAVAVRGDPFFSVPLWITCCRNANRGAPSVCTLAHKHESPRLPHGSLAPATAQTGRPETATADSPQSGSGMNEISHSDGATVTGTQRETNGSPSRAPQSTQGIHTGNPHRGHFIRAPKTGLLNTK